MKIFTSALRAIAIALALSFTPQLSAQFCTTGTYGVTMASSTFDEDLGNVTVGAMNNTSTCASVGPGPGSIQNRYSNYTGSVAGPSAIVGNPVAFSLSSITCNGNYGNGFQIYVDWNQNGLFTDPGEQAYSSSAAVTGPHTETGTFNVPVAAIVGSTRMRVVNVETSFPTSTNWAATGYTWGETEDYCFTVMSAAPCAGTPNAGTATITSSTGCPNASFTLASSGYSVASGINYQWQSGPTAAGPWTNIVGATNPSYTTSTTTTTFYQLFVLCTFSASSSTSNVVSYTVVNPGPCQCSPYAVFQASSTADEDMSNVTVGSMNNSSTCLTLAGGPGSIQNRYSNYTGIVTPTVEQLGNTVNFSLSSITCGGNYGNGFQIYIDYNQNGVFTDPGERGYSSANAVTGPHTESGSFTIPVSALPGLTRMRVVNVEAGFPTTTNYAATGYTWGETEDYCINLVAPPPIDIQALALLAPTTTGCKTASETIRVRLRNFGTNTLDFSVTPATVNASVTGVNPQTFAPYVINTGTLAPLATLDTTVATGYNMTAAGLYTFRYNVTLSGDGNINNDTLAPVAITLGGGVAVAGGQNGRICLGNQGPVTVSGYTAGGTIQWQESSDNVTWTNVVGATTPTYNFPPLDTMFYRAVICGMHNSVSDTLFPEFVAPPTTTNDTICGFGTVTLGAAGAGTLNWFDSSTGGNMVNSGTSYTVSISATDTFYVENTSGTPPSIHTTTFAAGNGSNGNMFGITALNTVTITGFDGHVSSGTSTWEIYYRTDNYLLVPGANTSPTGWILLGTAANVPAAGTGLPTPIPITFNVTIPAGQTYSFHVVTTAGSGVNYTNGTAAGNVYNANPDFQFREGHGGILFNCTNVPRVFNGRIHYSAGCGSARVPVIGVVTPAPVVTATSSNSICGSGSSTLVASSSNPAYDYSWTPAATLNTSVGDTVIASPSTTTTYLVLGTDATTGCVDTASVVVMHAISPPVNATVSDDSVCGGTATMLDVVPTFTNPVIVGTGTIQNTATSYPAPYGHFYWGSRHQMLILASELTAAGLNPGMIDALSFEVTNTNASSPLDNYEIKMATTSATSITTFQSPTFTSVFFAASYMPVVGVNTHTFTTLFYWDGVSNIIVETCHNNTFYTNNCSMMQTATAFSSTVYYRADASGVCANNAVTGSAFQRPNLQLWSTPTWSFSWTPAATLDNPLIQNPTATPFMSTMYLVDVTDSASGCVSTDSVFVFIEPTPNPSFGPDTAICSNATLVLDGTAGPHTFMWQDNSTNQTFTVNSFGNYSVVVTNTVTGCVGGDTILVGIDAAPSFTLGSDVTVCQGAQVSFTGPSGQYDYMWNTADTTAGITTGTAGSYDLAVTDTVNGCTSMDTVMLTVNPVPAVDLGNDTSVCSANGSITLTGPAGSYEYLWSTGDTTMSISVNSTGNYFVVVTDTTTSCYSGDTLLLTYNISPVADLGNDTTFCSANGPITLVGPAGSYTYVWNDMSTSMTLQAGTTGLYYVDVLDTATGCTTTDSITVNVPQSPSFTLTDTSFCGTQFTINGPAGSYDYDWSTLDSTQSITVTTSGTYTLTVTDIASGCNTSDVSTVNINAIPTVTLTASDLGPCEDDANVILTGTPAGGTLTGQSLSGNQFDPSIGVGTYQIVYSFTDVNGCSANDTVAIEVDACVGINEPFAGTGMNIYPNPNTGVFMFVAADQNCKELTIELTTVEGQVIYSNQYSNVLGNFSQEINMAEFANGVYFLRVTTDGAAYTQRVIKQE